MNVDETINIRTNKKNFIYKSKQAIQMVLWNFIYSDVQIDQLGKKKND
jgi:hypothetical protein